MAEEVRTPMIEKKQQAVKIATAANGKAANGSGECPNRPAQKL